MDALPPDAPDAKQASVSRLLRLYDAVFPKLPHDPERDNFHPSPRVEWWIGAVLSVVVVVSIVGYFGLGLFAPMRDCPGGWVWGC